MPQAKGGTVEITEKVIEEANRKVDKLPDDDPIRTVLILLIGFYHQQKVLMKNPSIRLGQFIQDYPGVARVVCAALLLLFIIAPSIVLKWLGVDIPGLQ